MLFHTSLMLFVALLIGATIAIILVAIFTNHYWHFAAVIVVIVIASLYMIVPIAIEEAHDFYQDNIYDVVMEVNNNATRYEKIAHINNVCSHFAGAGDINKQLCIEFARKDIFGE